MKKINETRVAGMLKSFVDLRQWSDFDRLKFFFIYILQTIGNFFSPSAKPPRQDSFNKVIQQYHLSDAQLTLKRNAFYRIAICMCVLGVLGLSYTVYMLIYGTWRAVMLSTVVDLLAWVLAFRYHFWYFQVKERKLGVTFSEWYKNGLMGR